MTKLYKINTLAVYINTVGWESLHSCSTGCIGGSLQDQDTLIEQSDTKITSQVYINNHLPPTSGFVPLGDGKQAI